MPRNLSIIFLFFFITSVLLSTCEAATIKKQPAKKPVSEGVWSTVAELATRVVRQLADDLSSEDSVEDDETNVKKGEVEAEANAATPAENDDDEEDEEDDDDDDLGFFGRRVQRSVEEQKEQKEHKEIKENETEAEAESEPVKGSESAATPNFSVLILIRNALKKVTTNLPAEQVATNALHYFQLFEHFLQQTIEQVIDDVDDDKDDETTASATTIASNLAENMDKGTATEATNAATETATKLPLNMEINSPESEKQPELPITKPMSMLVAEETSNEMSNNALTALEMTTTVPSL